MAKGASSPVVRKNDSKPKTLSFDLPDPEFVFGIVAAVGTDTAAVLFALETSLKKFGYSPNSIRISNFLKGFDLGIPLLDGNEYERISTRMDGGNKACRIAGRNDFLALVASSSIAQSRTIDRKNKRPMPRLGTAHIISSLKRPEEVQALRRIYGAGFLLIGVFATEQNRTTHLVKNVGMTEEQAKELIARDFDESDAHGQGTRDTFHLADVFIPLGTSDYKAEVSRFLDLLFGYPYHTPTQEEYAMFLAFASSLRSADLSRQVGAVVLSADNEVLGIGCNDVPRATGGLYWPGADDCRDYILKQDTNEIRRNEIIADIIARLRPDIPSEQRISRGKRLLKDSSIFEITEFGRATHAEMEAILSAARVGISLKGATLFSTTFPCHNCTRHLITVGIKRVVYIEPYPKSKAEDLHLDSIKIEEHGENQSSLPSSSRVSFEPFTGIGPRRYTDLFATTLTSGKKISRKRDGKTIRWIAAEAVPRVPMLPNSYLERELVASHEIDETMERLKGTSHEKK